MKVLSTLLIPVAVGALACSLALPVGPPAAASAAPPPSDSHDKAVQQLIEELSAPPLQRIKAVQELGKLGDHAQAAAGALCAVALDSPEAVRKAALEALQKVRPDVYRQMHALLLTMSAPPAAPTLVEFSRIRSRWARGESDERTAYITGQFKNVTERPIVALQLTITLSDAAGKIVAQETCEVVNSKLVHAADKARLEPGHSRFFLFMPKKTPAEWHEGKVAIDVKTIDFAG